MPKITNKGEAVNNLHWGHDGIFRWRLTGARNDNMCVHFDPNVDLTKMQMFDLFFFRFFIEGVTT